MPTTRIKIENTNELVRLRLLRAEADASLAEGIALTASANDGRLPGWAIDRAIGIVAAFAPHAERIRQLEDLNN